MSATNMAPGATPVLVVDAMELAEYVRKGVADPEHGGGSYSDIFSAKKTDIAISPAVAVTASRQVLQSDVHSIIGWAITETTGTANAQIRLFDGMSVNSEQFGRINLLANESVRDWFVPKGIRCFTGNVFLQIITGSVEGVIYWI